ncbi:small ribosomal subunit protein uS17m-like [Macrobrachium nipponense]|uniref:small ribosomal subunit protein uS17m-like n=1 Tax=Macrobrachium nipponense TaxID=159736 RepID=UPI0030C86E3E
MSGLMSKNLMLIGQCLAHSTKNAARVRVKRMKLDDYLHMYFPEYTDYFAHDPEQKCKVGDVVLIKELPEQMTKDITHSLMKIVYPYGDITDPITGKKCVVGNYRDHTKLRSELYGKAEGSDGGFDYDNAPDRGWQENRRDFTHKEGYMKWHEFEPGHPLHNDPAAT